jgi:SH3-like domain-containing protein
MTKEKGSPASPRTITESAERPVRKKPWLTAGAAIAAGLLGFAGATGSAQPAQAQSAGQNVARGPSGLPLPRFVSLKSGRVNARVGPGLNYAVEWLYMKPGLPMEILQEYDNWRKVRDSDGAEGWINQSLLSGKRTGITAPWQRGKDAGIALRTGPAEEAATVAVIEPGVIGTIKSCNGEWCEMSFQSYSGWLSQALIWGAYPGETITD